jgi:hypothetical protein
MELFIANGKYPNDSYRCEPFACSLGVCNSKTEKEVKNLLEISKLFHNFGLAL